MSNYEVVKDIYKTCKESIKLEAFPLKQSKNEDLEVWESKFGGIPYLPKGISYPRNKSGDPLYLLAQINLLYIPHLEPFPRDGILQFYIENNDMLGMETEWSEASYKVLYIPHSDNYDNQQDLSFLEPFPEDFPIRCPHKLSGYKTLKPIPPMDLNFDTIFKKYLHEQEEPDFKDLYTELINWDNTHQIGGHPSFIQEGVNLKDTEVVLLQVGYSDYVSFGDAGIATFIIEKEDLKNNSFSKVRYYWDCC